MKKATIGLLLFATTISTGCQVNQDRVMIDKNIEKASNKLDKLINSSYKDIQNGFGVPYSSVYYIDSSNLENKNIKNITENDIKNSVVALSSYNHPEYKDKFLHVYFENGVVKNAITDKYDMFTNERIVPYDKIQNIDYKLQFFRGNGSIFKEKFNVSDARKMFTNKNINDFNKYYNTENANFVATNMKDNSKLYFYNLVNFDPNKVDELNNTLQNRSETNIKPKVAIINPINNNIVHINEINQNDLSQYARLSLAVKTDENGKIKWIKILNKEDNYELIKKSFNLK